MGWAGSATVMLLKLIVSDYRRRGRSNRGHCATCGCLRPTNDVRTNSTAHVAHASLGASVRLGCFERRDARWLREGCGRFVPCVPDIRHWHALLEQQR